MKTDEFDARVKAAFDAVTQLGLANFAGLRQVIVASNWIGQIREMMTHDGVSLEEAADAVIGDSDDVEAIRVLVKYDENGKQIELWFHAKHDLADEAFEE